MIIHSNTKLAQLNNRIKECHSDVKEENTSSVVEEVKTEKVARKNNKIKKSFVEEEVIPSEREED